MQAFRDASSKFFFHTFNLVCFSCYTLTDCTYTLTELGISQRKVDTNNRKILGSLKTAQLHHLSMDLMFPNQGNLPWHHSPGNPEPNEAPDPPSLWPLPSWSLLLCQVWNLQALCPHTNGPHCIPPLSIKVPSSSLHWHSLAPPGLGEHPTVALQRLFHQTALRSQPCLPHRLPDCLLPLPLQTARDFPLTAQLQMPGLPQSPELCHSPRTLPLQHHSSSRTGSSNPSLPILGLHARSTENIYRVPFPTMSSSPIYPTGQNSSSRITNGLPTWTYCWMPPRLTSMPPSPPSEPPNLATPPSTRSRSS